MIELLVSLLIQIASLTGTPAPNTQAGASVTASATASPAPSTTTLIGDDKWDND